MSTRRQRLNQLRKIKEQQSLMETLLLGLRTVRLDKYRMDYLTSMCNGAGHVNPTTRQPYTINELQDLLQERDLYDYAG